MDIQDYFRWYREDINGVDYSYKTVEESIQRNKEITEIKKRIDYYRLKNQIKKKQTKLERIRDEFFYKVQQSIGGNAKYLVAFPPTKGSKIEFVDILSKNNDWLELTITFIPMYRSVFKDIDIKTLLHTELSFFKGIEYLLIPEYNKSNHLHYHGFIRGKPSTINKVKNMLSSQFGRTELKGITYYNSYIEYVFKDVIKGKINYFKYTIENII